MLAPQMTDCIVFLGQLKKTASGGLAYPKKFLETVEHQFISSDGLVEISDPFDNRFEVSIR